MSRCEAITKSDEQCKNTSKEGEKYCGIHLKKEVNSSENSNNKRQRDWQDTHANIVSKYIELLRLNKRSPTLQQVADETGYHINTVWRHVNEMDISDHVETSGTRALTQDVLLGIANAARKGSAANAKLFMQIVHGWSDSLDLKSSDGSMTPKVIERRIVKADNG